MPSKSISICILVLIMAAACPVWADLVIHWSLDESAGGSASDSVGDSHGTLIGNTIWNPAGQFGGAAQFDGTDDSIRVRADAGPYPVSDYPFTIMGWCKSTKSNAKAVIACIVKDNNEYYWIGLLTGNAGIVARTDSGMHERRSGSGIADDQWHHLCGVYNGPEDRVLYLDGVEVATDDRTAPFLPEIRQFAIGALDRDPAGENIVDEMLGSVDDVAVFDEALDLATINQYMTSGIPTQGLLASTPAPADGAEDVVRDNILSWASGEYAGTHNLYWGTSFQDVNSATVPMAADLDVNAFDLERLEFDTTYYWRVDEVNATPDKTVFKGMIWSFKSEPYSIRLEPDAIAVTASSASNEFSTPEKTIDGSGLGADDTHGIASETMWFSATGDVDPWIQYEFDDVKKLDVMMAWNANSAAEAAIGWGIKDVQIMYSEDGENWAELADANQLSRAPGLPTYNAYDEIAFNGVAAQYVRLSISSNWGGLLPAYGLSEVQFYSIPTTARTPEPASGSADIQPNAMLSWRAGRDAAQHTVYIGTDEDAVTNGTAQSVLSTTNSLGLASLDLQLGETYYWRVDEVNDAEAKTVWPGPVWSFSTPTALIVDDFEGYGNNSPDRPFQTWLDGFGYSADEFFPQGYGGNGTGSGIGHDIWTLTSPHYNGQIMEADSTIVGSSRSMPLYYTNTGGVASQTERTFEAAQDWTIGGAQTLSIAFRGQADNTGTLYAVINNTKVQYPRDPANIALDVWQAWNIDLTALNTNLEAVTKLVIGIEGNNASGMILVDDIKLHAQPGEVITPVDPGTVGLVAHYSFEGHANDVTGNGNDGTVNGDAQFVAGHDGSALDCDGIDDYVSTGKTASDLGIGGNNARTVSSWVFTRSFANGGVYDLGARVNGQDYCLRTLTTENNWRVQYWGGAFDTDFVLDTMDKWVHFTHVHDGTHTKIYANGRLIVDHEVTLDTPNTNPFQIGCYGWQVNYFDGLIDEVRVYDRALSAGEALSLAGATTPIDQPF